jgi:uncharacterized protein
MSRAPADLVNAVELAGRNGRLERTFELPQLPRLVEAGALEGTRATAQLAFGRFEGRVTVEVRIDGQVVLACQRCMQPCGCEIEESALLAVVAQDTDELPGGYEPLLGDAERLSLIEVIEEQILLALPLVPMHATGERCEEVSQAAIDEESVTAAEDKQRPFANLRELLEKGRR